MKPAARSILLTLACLTSAGCVHYVPVDDLASLPPDEEVRVHVTDEGAIRMARRFGRIRDEVTASVAPVDPDSLSVTVWIGKAYRGTSFENVRETVVLGRNEVTAVARKRLSAWRTAAASAAVVAGLAVLVDRIFLIEDPNRPDDNGTDPPPPAIISIFRIPIGPGPGGAR